MLSVVFEIHRNKTYMDSSEVERADLEVGIEVNALRTPTIRLNIYAALGVRGKAHTDRGR